jgi:hypothetical protein
LAWIRVHFTDDPEFKELEKEIKIDWIKEELK